ncbi:MAG: hypothetical protein N3A61_06240, partial [Ignavibacteria bacterium]|nr:hypothetical protein [Ignavibacteria bacterium]
MSVNLYIIIVIATLLVQFSCIVMGIRAGMRSDIKFGWGFIVFILIVIAIIHFYDLISIEQFKRIKLSDLPIFEITSLIGSITLLSILIFLEISNRIQLPLPEYERIPKVEPVIKPEPIVPTVEEDKSHIAIAEKEKEITNLKKELEKVSAQKDKLVSIISHDLRTPLSSVFGYCQILKDGQFKGRNEVRKFAENIFDLSKQQLSALNKILDWTRVESKDLQLNPTDFEISSTINFVAKSFSKIAESKNVNIVVSSDYHGPDSYT